MKAVILAGGLGTRLAEETSTKPKPMVEIGGKPIIWHIMKTYAHFGITDFVICCGYKGYLIKEYFANYFIHSCDVTVDMRAGSVEIINQKSEPWRVTMIDTGGLTGTAGRLKRVGKYIEEDKFCFTYGDGVSDLDLRELIDAHNAGDALVTVTAVKPPGRYGALCLEANKVARFKEKADGEDAWISGGYFICDSRVINEIGDKENSWEEQVLPRLAARRELAVYKHNGFWHPMDTLRDKLRLEEMIEKGEAPWERWKAS